MNTLCSLLAHVLILLYHRQVNVVCVICLSLAPAFRIALQSLTGVSAMSMYDFPPSTPYLDCTVTP